MSICSWLAVLISSGLISLSLGETAQPTRAASLTVREIERLYNDVLHTCLESSREKLKQLNDSNAIDQQYFIELDRTVGTESYHSTAYFIFALINSSLLSRTQPDQLLQQMLPVEKVSMRNFFSLVRRELLQYFASTQQSKSELMRNVTHWQEETGDGIVLAYLAFPQQLQAEVPELQLMDYMKQARGLVEGITQALFKTLP